MRKIRQEVWIDGKKHVIEREQTLEEYEQEIRASVQRRNTRMLDSAIKVAESHGRDTPNEDDWRDAKRKDTLDFLLWLLFTIAVGAISAAFMWFVGKAVLDFLIESWT